MSSSLTVTGVVGTVSERATRRRITRHSDVAMADVTNNRNRSNWRILYWKQWKVLEGNETRKETKLYIEEAVLRIIKQED